MIIGIGLLTVLVFKETGRFSTAYHTLSSYGSLLAFRRHRVDFLFPLLTFGTPPYEIRTLSFP